jgi:hypothetical protein
MTPQAESAIIAELKRIADALEKNLSLNRGALARLLSGQPLTQPDAPREPRPEDLSFTEAPGEQVSRDLDIVMAVNTAIMAGVMRVGASGVVELAQ